MMVNFPCQLDWTTGCPNSWLNIFLGASLIEFLDEINIRICSLKKADCLCQSGWTLSSLFKAWMEQQRSRGKFAVSSRWNISPLPLDLDSDWNYPSSVLPPGLWPHCNSPLSLLGLQLADCRSWDLVTSISQFLYISSIGCVFLGNWLIHLLLVQYQAH